MTRLELERPGEFERDAPDPVLEAIRRHGREHEQRVLQRFRSEGLRIIEVPDEGDRHAATIAALQQGPDIVYQAALKRDSFAGYCDFLVRREGVSRFGDYLYEPLEAKAARRVKPDAAVQLASYAAMLEGLQGAGVGRLHLALGSGEQVALDHASVRFFFAFLERTFLQFHDTFDAEDPPQPEPGSRHFPWDTEAKRRTLESDGLEQVADITSSQIRRLRAAGVLTRVSLGAHDGSAISGIQQPTLDRLVQQARLQLESTSGDRPAFERLAGSVSGRGPGLADLPKASPLDVYFDLEGYPLGEHRLEYLWGASTEAGFKDWWAFDATEEKKTFEEFLLWVLARRSKDPGMHVYHYGAYETSVLKRLAASHALLETELDVLLREERFVDLYRIVRNGLRIGEPSYSLKNVEKLYRDARAGEVETAGDSIVQYDYWIQSGQPADWRSSEILASIRRYNQDDCDSTRELTEWLRTLRGDEPALPPADMALRAETDQRRTQRLRRAEVADGLEAAGRPFAPLFAQLLDFHQREERPAWWTFFDQAAMSEQQLYEDFNCLAGLTCRRRAKDAANGRTFRYDFEPGQLTKIDAGSSCYVDGNLDWPVEVTAMELERGAVRLEFGYKAWNALERTAPRRVSLIPRDLYRTDTIAGAILRLAQRYVERGELPRPLEHFLERRRPVLRESHGGSLVKQGETSTEAVPRLCASMDRTSLVIQGPPGSGKTTTAAQAIVRLLQDGATVGVASNSHKAILNLIGKCVEIAPETVRPVKAGGSATDELMLRHPQIRHVSNPDVAALLARHPLAGGTAWLFSREELAGRFDYLFVDEAGQVPLANLAAMARSAKNLVLVGDPIQLPQPTQGAHPGDSGQSSLEYALDGHATIAPELGVFLDRSFRLHPALCRTISQGFYDGRLASAEGRENRIVHLRPDLDEELKGAGLAFVAVPHEGNTQSSDEEVERIAGLVERLASCEVTGLDGAAHGTLGHDGILVVAPYNLQVRKLKRALPDGVQVGTVDRFQGQEAPVVLVSMCASDAHRSPRGLGFLLDPNRLNVALSRAQCLAVVVGNPGLVRARAETFEQLERINLFARILAEGAI
jgi:uncharacterized protein